MTWHTEAACRGVDIKVFYPVPEARVGRPPATPTTSTLYDEARTICNGCPVRDECLHEAMAEEHGAQRFGFRGGLTWRERGALPARVCRWCSDWFPVEPRLAKGGRHPHYCSDPCRDAGREQRRLEELERQRIARWQDRNTECEVCGFESRTTSGLAAHRRQLHGLAA